MGTALATKKKTTLKTAENKETALNAKVRKFLKSHLSEVIDMSIENEEIKELSTLIDTKLINEIEAKVNKSDLEVLRKYGETSHCSGIWAGFKDTTGKVTIRQSYWKINPQIEIPDRWGGGNYSYATNWGEWRYVSEELWSLFEKYDRLIEEFRIKRENKISSYILLIENSKTLNQLAVVWKDVDKYIEKYSNELDSETKKIIPISKEAVALVVQDVEKRLKSNG